MYNKQTRIEENIFFGSILGICGLAQFGIIGVLVAGAIYPPPTKQVEDDTQTHCDLSGEAINNNTEKSLRNTLNELAKGREYSVDRIYHSTTTLSNGKQITVPCVSYKFK